MENQHKDLLTPGLLDAEVANGLVRVRLKECLVLGDAVQYLCQTHEHRMPEAPDVRVQSYASELGAALSSWNQALRQAAEAGFEAHAALSKLTEALRRQ